ncbi:hypothetical protein [Natrinema versiforme]|uniref:Lrp/AsnC family transcriptional regulator n=1 Tax=Natrinema versiforme TaxID=88724 RepID=A0A4P8WMN6_9EURY|nr:hypothetical protein [Natrinema versiforme]QCS44694.1 hypothetical protein FEJ81_20575 [Natrinema versiforme]
MDRFDDRLVDACRRNGDVTDRDGTTKLIRRRLRLLEADDALKDVAVRVNYDRLGYRTAVIWLTVDMAVVDHCIERLQARPAFVTVYEVSGTPNVFAVGKFRHELALATCLEDLLTATDVRSVSVDRVEAVVEEGPPVNPPDAIRSR